MNASDRMQVLRTLGTRRDVIADGWYQAITGTSYVPFKAADVRQQLVDLTDRIIALLPAEPLERERAEAIGASLAGLHYLHPEALGRTQEVLANQLVEGLPAGLVAALQPQLAVLLARLAAGFLQQTCKMVLEEQEAIRSALADELQRMHHTIRAAYEHLEHQVEERTAELRKSNELLQQEILEREQVEEDLRRSEGAVRALLDATTADIVALMDAHGTILDVNEAGVRRFGRRADELVGLYGWDLVPSALAERRKARAAEVVKSGSPVRFEDEREGTWFDNVFYPVFDEQGQVTSVAVLARDITERKRVDEELHRSLAETARGQRLLLALSHAARAVQRAHTPEEIYQIVGDEIAELGYDALVYTLTEDGTHLAVNLMTYEPRLLRAAEKLAGLSWQDYRFPLTPDGRFRRMLTASDVLFTDQPAGYMAEAMPVSVRPLASQLATLLGIEQIIHAPLVVDEEMHGLLVVTGSGLSQADTEAVSAFAHQAAIALSNVRLYQQTRSWAAELEQRVGDRTEELSATAAELENEIAERRRMEAKLRRSRAETLRNHRLLMALSQAAQTVQRARTSEEVYEIIGDEVARLGYRVIVFLLNEHRAHLTLAYAALESAVLGAAEKLAGLPALGLRVPLAPGGPFHRVIYSQESTFFEHTADHIVRGVPRLGRPLVDRVVGMLGIERSIYAPLTVGGEPLGLLAVAGTELTEADVPAVTVFANQAAIALENTRLIEKLSISREQLRQLTQELVAAQEEERLRLSRALHDEAGQALTALKINLELIGQGLPVESDAVRKQMGEAIALTDKTMKRVRLLAQDLRPPALDAVGLNPTLGAFCRDFAAQTRLSIDYRGTEVPMLAESVNICLYRFLQEALTNVVKHARARAIGVTLRHDAEAISLWVEDDGQGFEVPSRLSSSTESLGLGLLGMEERLESLGGRLEITSQPGEGTRLVAYVPLEEASPEMGASDGSKGM
jgi:PAS domain S-box-containing protein